MRWSILFAVGERMVEPELPENPPPDAKWKAKQGLNRLNLNGAEHDVMGCLVDRANATTGLCYPSEEFIAGWTGRPLRTVQRAIRSLWHKRLINITRRSATSDRYFIAWARTLLGVPSHQQVFERDATAASRRRHKQKVAGESCQKWRVAPAPEVAAEPRKEPMKENLSMKWRIRLRRLTPKSLQ